MAENMQWVKPIMPGDVPEGMKPVWNPTTAQWDHVKHEDHPMYAAEKLQALRDQANADVAAIVASGKPSPLLPNNEQS